MEIIRPVPAIWGRTFSPTGEPVTDEFPIGEKADDLIQSNPAVAALPGGGFMVYWSQQESTISRRWDVFGQTFAADGTAAGSAFRVNDYTTGDQFGPKVVASADRQFVVWTSVGQDGSREGIYGRQLLSGALDGGEFRVNTTTVNRQWHPALGSDGQGRVFAVWSGFAGASGLDLYGKKYSAPAGTTTASVVPGVIDLNRGLNSLNSYRPLPPLPVTPLTPQVASVPTPLPGSP